MVEEVLDLWSSPPLLVPSYERLERGEGEGSSHFFDHFFLVI